MQTILGAGGAIGTELAKELKNYTDKIRLVGRHPKKVNDNDELFIADLTIESSVSDAVKGSEVVYLVAGLKYDIKTWSSQWPVIMNNVIKACEQHRAKLVFFDNVYMYDPKTLNDITEENPVKPSSKKGKIRAQIAKMMQDEIKAGKLTGVIVRSADFYGPNLKTSFITETVYKNLLKGKRANWIGDPGKIHSATYTPDAAKATALLGNTPDSYNQVWHTPTDTQTIKGLDWIALFAKEMDKKPEYKTITGGMVKLLGVVNGFMSELGEMMYQYQNDYFFNSSKFRNRFPQFKVTSYQDGVKEIVAAGKLQ